MYIYIWQKVLNIFSDVQMILFVLMFSCLVVFPFYPSQADLKALSPIYLPNLFDFKFLTYPW